MSLSFEFNPLLSSFAIPLLVISITIAMLIKKSTN
jgi:hypothetical protein